MTIEAEPVVRHWTLNLPVRLRLLWGAVGLVFGIALTLFVLIARAPLTRARGQRHHRHAR